jgi:hypothetical protein
MRRPGIPAVAGALAAMILGAAAPAQEKKADLEPLKVDEKAGRITFGARVATFDKYPQLKGAIEYLITMPGGKEYESVLVAPLDPVALHAGLKKIGLAPGKSGGKGDDEKPFPPEGGKMRISVEWKDGETERKEPAENLVLDVLSGKPMDPKAWVFSGSREVFIPAEGKMGLGVLANKNVVGLFHMDATVLVQAAALARDPHQYKVNKAAAPKEGSPVRIVIEPLEQGGEKK